MLGAQRGQTIPFWTFAVFGMLAMALFVMNYSMSAAWNIRAQNAADSAAAAGLSTVANIYNEESTILYATAVDWPARDPRFTVVWEVRSLKNKTRIRIKTTAAMPEPHVPTLTDVWPAANWHERETWDLLGIKFDGHPDLRRLLMPQSWEGHPLRKDYVSFGEPVIFSDQKLEGLEPDAIRG